MTLSEFRQNNNLGKSFLPFSPPTSSVLLLTRISRSLPTEASRPAPLTSAKSHIPYQHIYQLPYTFSQSSKINSYAQRFLLFLSYLKRPSHARLEFCGNPADQYPYLWLVGHSIALVPAPSLVTPWSPPPPSTDCPCRGPPPN